MTVIALALVFAALLGFASHRASVCTVKAVAEVLSTRRGHMFAGFVKIILWIEVVTLTLLAFGHELEHGIGWWPFSLSSAMGGVLFGIGAALNRGCAFATVSRLAAGELRMMATLAGLALGMASHLELITHGVLSPASPSTIAPIASPTWIWLVTAALWLWGAHELIRLWRTRARGIGAMRLLVADAYRLSTAAVLMGLGNGLLYALLGPWAYTRFIEGMVDRSHPGDAALLTFGALFVALLAGASLSAWLRGRPRLRWRPSPAWNGNLAGGYLMGLGAALAPGGNDVLILHAIPSFSPHALPTYASMIAGIMLVLVPMRLMTGEAMQVSCEGDVCR